MTALNKFSEAQTKALVEGLAKEISALLKTRSEGLGLSIAEGAAVLCTTSMAVACEFTGLYLATLDESAMIEAQAKLLVGFVDGTQDFRTLFEKQLDRFLKKEGFTHMMKGGSA